MSVNIDTEFNQNKVECSTIVTSCNQMGLFQEFKVDLALKMVQILSILTEILENAKSPIITTSFSLSLVLPTSASSVYEAQPRMAPSITTQDPPAIATLNYCQNLLSLC